MQEAERQKRRRIYVESQTAILQHYGVTSDLIDTESIERGFDSVYPPVPVVAMKPDIRWVVVDRLGRVKADSWLYATCPNESYGLFLAKGERVAKVRIEEVE